MFLRWWRTQTKKKARRRSLPSSKVKIILFCFSHWVLPYCYLFLLDLIIVIFYNCQKNRRIKDLYKELWLFIEPPTFPENMDAKLDVQYNQRNCQHKLHVLCINPYSTVSELCCVLYNLSNNFLVCVSIKFSFLYLIL